ncbi:MAG: purine-nucleoside phosphorylase [Chloroflexi bacterium]|nr:MAG: purine-nucleoside phosphorylase [Chloroflexota bacterium]
MAYTREDYMEAVQAIQAHTNLKPAIGLVLGSGLGGLADTFEERVVIPYDTIPNWPKSTVPGHQGQLVIGKIEGQTVVAQQGRAHLYEGYTPEQITFPVRVMHFLGAKTIILTNAAGGLNKSFNIGDVMIINDHIYFTGMAGLNALSGPNDESIGPRFIGMANAYDRELRTLAVQVAAENDIQVHQGVYACLSGPTFETPAEVRMLRALGADAVGMSTVHEVVVARHAGMRVLAISGITNISVDDIDAYADSDYTAVHEEVLEVGKIIVPRLITVLRGVLRAL